MRVKQCRMPEPMNLRGGDGGCDGKGWRQGFWRSPVPLRSRGEAEDDGVLPDDPGAEDLAHIVVVGLRALLCQRLQLCVAQSSEPARHVGVGKGVPTTPTTPHAPAMVLLRSSAPHPPLPAIARSVFLARSSCCVANSQRGDSSSSAGHLRGGEGGADITG